MEMHTVYITWKTQPCIDVPSPQIDIQVECNQNLIRIFFCRYKQADSKILCGKQSNEISPILKNKRLDKSYCSIFNTYCKATVFETVWYWRTRPTDEWDKIESWNGPSQMCPIDLWQKNVSKSSVFPMWCWNSLPCAVKGTLTWTSQLTQILTQMEWDVNVKIKTVKLFEETIENLY